MSEPTCPKCAATYTYPDGSLWICPQCSHEWPQHQSVTTEETAPEAEVIRDAHGSPLSDGDAVSVIKDLKVKGASSALKAGTKVKSIKLIYGSADGHNISCKIDGFGAMGLKSEFVKKI